MRALLEGLLDLLAPPRCAACDAVLEAGACGFCDACTVLLEPDPLRVGAFLYGGPLADAIRRFKYGAQPELSRPLGALLADAAIARGDAADLVVPVPLHRARLAHRGYDQAALLARPVARALGVPLGHPLRRLRATRAQAGLAPPERSLNVRRAFACKPVEGAILLIDDVRTTGATLFACAEALREAGADEVRMITLARVEP